MRYRLLASYQGAPYEAGVGPAETVVCLCAACPPPEDLGFEPATGHWRKEVGRDDVHTLYESRPVGMFRGESCVVLDELTDRLHIAYLGHDAFRAEQLGYWEVDRGVFELITPRQEVTEIVEQRLPVAAPGESAPYSLGESPSYFQPNPQPNPQPIARHGLLAPGHASLPAADGRPLPLEAQAMRAARKAKEGQAEPAAGLSEHVAQLSEPASGLSEPVAQLSEPSSALPPTAEGPVSVPSWSPHPVTPQPAASRQAPHQPPSQRSAHAASHRDASDGPAHSPGSVVSAGFVAGVSPALTSLAGNQNQPAGAAHSGPFIGSAPIPHPGPQLPGAAQVNGTHHGGAAHAPVLRPVPGLPRDQLERPVSGMAASATPAASVPAPANSPPALGTPPGTGVPPAASSPVAGAPMSGYAPTTTARIAEVAGAPAGAGVGVAVADLGMPYAPAVAPNARPAGPLPEPASVPSEASESQPLTRRGRASRRRLPTHRIFSELAAQAGIPSGAYAINEDVDGAMCLVRTSEGFEVFNSLAGARHEVRVFQDEESAYFYLFGVLTAEAVRTGVLGPTP